MNVTETIWALQLTCQTKPHILRFLYHMNTNEDCDSKNSMID